MSRLEGLEYLAFAVDASPAWRGTLHEPHHRTFGPGDATRFDVVGGDAPPVDGTAELIAEQGDTLTMVITGHDAPLTLALTILSPTVGEMTVTSGAEWVRCVVALLGLPESHHDH